MSAPTPHREEVARLRALVRFLGGAKDLAMMDESAIFRDTLDRIAADYAATHQVIAVDPL